MTTLSDENRFSRLYCTYNGFMLGHFLYASRFKLSRRLYPVLRTRMQEFLDEVGVAFSLTESHDEFDSHYDEIAMATIRAVMDRSLAIAKSAHIGWSATFVAASPEDPSAAELKQHVEGFLEEQNVPAQALSRFIDAVPHDQESMQPEHLLSPALHFLCEVLDPIEAENKTCFVAMPFKEPFTGYFPTFYRPLLESTGYRALRAWGGFAREDFVDLIILLIRKSGAILADISQPNLNVFYEAGIALGGDADLFWIARKTEDFKPPSDLAADMILYYNPDETNWIERDLEQCRMYLLAALVMLEK